MAATTSLTCPECGGERTIRKGVCFRCGYREKAPTASSGKTQPTTPTTIVPNPEVTSPPVIPQPVPPIYSPPVAATPGAGAGNAIEGKITALGVPRTEVVALGPGDALARIVAKLAFVLVVVLVVVALFPFIVVLLILGLLLPGLRGLMPSPWLFLLGRGGGQNNQNQRQDVEIPVTPFTVTTPDGRRLEVVLRGELQGGSPHLGDTVSVQGRAGRNGTIHAKSITNTATGARTTTREHPALVKARIKTFGSLITLVCLCFIVYSVVSAYMM